MKKVKNIWINGFFRAWDMLYYFPLDRYFNGFFKIEKTECNGVQVLCGLLLSAFCGGLLLVIMNSLLVWLLGAIPGAVAGSLLTLFVMLWSDRGAGITLLSNMISGRVAGKSIKSMLQRQDSDPESVAGGIASSVFSVLVMLKLAIFYLIIWSGNFYLFILILLTGAFIQSFVLNVHTGSGAFFGFGREQERNVFYIVSLVLLLLGAKFNILVALAFAGGNIILTYFIKERLVRAEGGKSDESITLYGECAVIIAILTALVYSAGVLQR